MKKMNLEEDTTTTFEKANEKCGNISIMEIVEKYKNENEENIGIHKETIPK